MKALRKRALTLLLLLALIISGSACGSTPSGDSDTTKDTTTESETTTEYVPDFPDITLNDEEIVFLTENRDDIYSCREIYAESETGELINDSVYKRNIKIEERFKVKITEERANGAASQAQRSIMAGDDSYDVVMPYMNDSISNALNGLYMNLYDVPNLELDSPWWDQRANDSLTVDGNLYFTTGDISILDNECTMVIFFNKQIIENSKLESPYDLVKSGKWTMEKFFGMAEEAASDLNGDSQMNIEDDQFGLFCQDNVPHSLWFGSGERISTVDKNGTIRLTMNTARSAEIIPYILEKCQSDSIAKMYDWSDDGFRKSVAAFNGGRILFAGWSLADISYIRDCKYDFGILPYPKYDENQSEYYNLISTILVPGVSIPVTNKEPEKAGLILEAMAYYSVDTLTAAYYDNALHTRYVRDEESGDMLDIIFATRVYDLGFISNVGGLGQVIGSLYRGKQTNFASTYESMSSAAEVALEKLTESFRTAAEITG